MATRSPREDTRTARAQRDPNAAEKPKVTTDRQKVAAAQRSERVPLGAPRTKLSVPKRPGYERRWINDDDKGRLQNALNGGYTHVTDPNLRVGQDGGGDKTDSRVSRIVGRGEGSKPLRAFLMEIPSEMYKKDQASKQAELDEVDRAIRKGALVSRGEEHRYVPKGGIRVEREKRSGSGDAETAGDDAE